MNIVFTCLLLFLSEDIPAINQRIVIYLNEVIGTQVKRGECWDLAAAALDYSGGYLDRSSQKTLYVFGKPVDPANEKVYPGDIIQFENVALEYQEGNMIFIEKMPHHTAIIFEVLKPGQYMIAHQNSRSHGKKVGVTKLNLKDLKKGELIFYRPVLAKGK